MTKDNEIIVRERDELVVQSNELLRDARYTLSASEQRLLIYVISKIEVGDNEFKPVKITKSDYLKVCGINSSGKNYRHIEESIQDLADKSWWFKHDQAEKKSLVRWFDDVDIDTSTGELEVKLHHKLEEYLLHLKGNFTKYNLVNVLYLKGKYAIRLYEIFKSYLWDELTRASWEVKMDELRDILQTEDKYPVPKDFRRRIIEPSVKEINEHTNIYVEYEPFYKGKKLEGYKFVIEWTQDQEFEHRWNVFQNQKKRLNEK